MENGDQSGSFVAAIFVFCALWVAAFTLTHFILFFYNNARGASSEEMRAGKTEHKLAAWIGVIVGFLGAVYYYSH